MSKGQTLGSMLTVTGTSDSPWATTCNEYMQWMWPNTGMTVLCALQRVAMGREESSACHGDFGIEIDVRPIPLGGSLESRVRVQGSREEIVQVAQQLAWIATIFRTGSTGLSFSDFELEAIPGDFANSPSSRFSLKS